MEINFKEMLEQVSDKVKSMANTDTVIGEAFELGAYKCKPVIKVGVGFGSGSGSCGPSSHKSKADSSGTGAGAGIGIAPVGFLVSKGDDIQFIPAGNKGGLSTLFEKMPEIMDKCIAYKKEKEEGTETDKKAK
jgi:uncharacterized spore protein YtfJ